MDVSPSVDDVYRDLLDRILTGAYPAGSRLPSCRALARELGSNSSTVDRAVGRLAQTGRVRTVPRRGTFVEDTRAEAVDARSVVGHQLDEVLLRARRLGFTEGQVVEMVHAALERVGSMRRIAVVECNERDLRTVQNAVQRSTGVEVQPVLLSEAQGRLLDEEFDAVAVPVFHLNDVAPYVTDLDRVVELNLVASPSALRRIIDVRSHDRLVVVAPTQRGVQWMTALVGQYFPGQIVGFNADTDDVSVLDGEPVVVVNNAVGLGTDFEERVGELIAIEWEIDGRFVPVLRSRIESVIADARSDRDQGAPTTRASYPLGTAGEDGEPGPHSRPERPTLVLGGGGHR
ncbi:MAG: hypothetical protein CMH83_14720 [Nocardioides sp.]|nr:hypothetical protein [Nocardioides sp.]